MIFKPNDDDEDEKPDFFEGEDLPEPVKKEKKPDLKPDDPRYWEQEEGEWEHLRSLRPRHRVRIYLWLAAVVVLIGTIVALYLRFFATYIEDATQYGYVEHIEKRGTLFKTYEGVLLPYKELTDTTRIYSRDFVFSAANASLGAKLKACQLAGKPVRVEYKQYHARVPWRGSSTIIVTAVDTADVTKILPPEFAPRR